MSKKDKTITLNCCGELHQIIIKRNRQLVLLNHTDPEELENEKTIRAFGGKACPCLELFLNIEKANYCRGLTPELSKARDEEICRRRKCKRKTKWIGSYSASPRVRSVGMFHYVKYVIEKAKELSAEHG